MTLRKLGAQRSRQDPRTLKVADYLQAVEPPDSYTVAKGIKTWPMFGNDTLGDCVAAGAAHMIEAWVYTATGKHRNLSRASVINFYSAISGYSKGNPSTDNGAQLIDACKFWRKNGISGYHLDAFAEVNVKNFNDVKLCLWGFGTVYIGLDLPLSAEDQVEQGMPWDISGKRSEAGSWGGHCVNIVAYDENYLTCVSWGQLQTMTWAFFEKYCSEGWALLSPTWLGGDKSPSGFNLAQLTADLAQLAAS